MNKAKLTIGAASAFLIVGTTAFQAFAAMPAGTVAIGNKAYSLDYANDPAHLAEIQAAFVASNNQIYVKDFNGKWIDNSNGSSLDASKIPAVTYTDGKTTTPYDNGDVDHVATATTVSSLSALNETTFQVTLSDTPTVTPTATDFAITASINGADAVTVTPVISNVTGNVVTLTVPTIAATNADQNVNYSLSYKNGQSKQINVLVKQAVQVDSVNDVSSKTAVQVLLKDGVDATKAADKTFYTVKVGTTAIPVTAVTYIPELKKATLTVNFDGKEGTVNVNGISAKNTVDYKAPDLVSATPVSDKKIDVKFSENVTSATATLAANYGIVLKGTAYSSAISGVTKIADDTYRIQTTASLTEGSVYTVSVNNITDSSSNANTMSKVQSLDLTAIKDTTKPTLVSATALDTNKIQVTMSEEIDSAASLPVIKVTPYNLDGTLGTPFYPSISSSDLSGNKINVSITNLANLLVNNKKYKFEISGGQDLSGNPISDAQAQDFLGVSDVTAPTIKDSSYDAKTGKFTIDFSEKMNISAASYSVFNTATGVNQNATISPALSTDGTQLVLTITGIGDNENYALKLNGLTDASMALNKLGDNTILNFNIPKTIIPVTLNSVTQDPAGTGNTVALNFNSNANIDKTEAENINNYKIVSISDATKTLTVTKAVYDSVNKKVTLTTGYQNANSDNSANYKVTVSNISNLDANSNSLTFAGVDKVAPTLQTVKSISQNYIDLNFDENIALAQNAVGFDITIIKTGTAEVVGSYSGSSIDSVSALNNRLRLHLTNALTDGSSYTITVKGVKDTFGNYLTNDTQPALKSVSTTFTAVKDTTPPALTGITVVNSAKLVLKFNEELTSAGVIGNYTLTDLGTNSPVAFASGSTVTLNPDDLTQVIIENKDANAHLADLLTNGEAYALKVTGGVKDVAQNIIDNNTIQSINFSGIKDTVSPKLLSATASLQNVSTGVNSTKVVLTFDKEINPDAANSTFNTNDFVVSDTTNFNQLTVASAKLGDNKNTIELTLSTPTSATGKYKVYVAGNITDVAVVGNVIDSNYRTALFSGVDTQAPTLTDMQLSGSLADGTAENATVAISSLNASNQGTITISGLANGAKYSTGSIKISENVGVTFAANNTNYSVTTPVQLSKDTDAQTLTSIVLTVLGGVDGTTTTQLQNENGSTITLKDAAGNASTYTIVIQ